MQVAEVVRQQITDRLDEADAATMLAMLEDERVPPYVEEERVCLAILKLRLEGHDLASIARVRDWRDLLVAARLESADWRQVLARAGLRLPP